jgi:hypothetical protein
VFRYRNRNPPPPGAPPVWPTHPWGGTSTPACPSFWTRHAMPLPTVTYILGGHFCTVIFFYKKRLWHPLAPSTENVTPHPETKREGDGKKHTPRLPGPAADVTKKVTFTPLSDQVHRGSSAAPFFWCPTHSSIPHSGCCNRTVSQGHGCLCEWVVVSRPSTLFIRPQAMHTQGLVCYGVSGGEA